MSLYEINFSVAFAQEARADTALAVAMDKWSLASGLPEDSMPEKIVNADGTFTVAGALRLRVQANRTAIKTALDTVGTVSLGGRYSYHKCHHDEGIPCEPAVTKVWGTYATA